MKITHFLFVSFFAFVAKGQNVYSVASIPEKLKEKAHAVIRTDQTKVKIESPEKIVVESIFAVTIFDETGEDKFGQHVESYDKFSKINSFTGAIFDKTGEQLKKLKKDDIKDISQGNFEAWFTDNRYKVASFDKKKYEYPYTVEFKVETQTSNTLFLPSWEPLNRQKVSVEYSSFSILQKGINAYRIQKNNIPMPINSTQEDYKVEMYEYRNVGAFEYEKFSDMENLPFLKLAPNDFKVDFYKGKLNSWGDLSSFYTEINTGRDQIPEGVIQKIKELTKNEKDKAKIAKIVYEYMQANTRYYLVALGIGGWQSMPASLVAEKGYGDCKALSNYYISMLKTLDIKAYPVLIHADEISTTEDEKFPNSTFNHVIACVPNGKDTLWAECTSQTNPFGYLGKYTGNRRGLLIDGQNGKRINTIFYKPENNLQSRVTKGKVDENGNVSFNVQNTYSGIQQESRFNRFTSATTEENKNWVLENTNIPNPKIISMNFKADKKVLPVFVETFDIESDKYATISGNRIFLKPNAQTKFMSKIADEEKERKTNLYLDPNELNFVDEDLAIWEIPTNYKVETQPKNMNLKTSFGEFETSYTIEQSQLKMKRKLKVLGGKYDKSEYAKWVEFVNAVAKSDNQKVVFIKN